MKLTPEQKALLTPLLARMANSLTGSRRLVDLVLADDRDAQLAALVGAEHAKVDAKTKALPAARQAEDTALADSLKALDGLKKAIEAPAETDAVAAVVDPV